MSYNTAGSFAGGFMTAFLAAQRLRMQREFYAQRTAYYQWLMRGGNSNPQNTPYSAAQAANNSLLQQYYGVGTTPASGGGVPAPVDGSKAAAAPSALLPTSPSDPGGASGVSAVALRSGMQSPRAAGAGAGQPQAVAPTAKDPLEEAADTVKNTVGDAASWLQNKWNSALAPASDVQNKYNGVEQTQAPGAAGTSYYDTVKSHETGGQNIGNSAGGAAFGYYQMMPDSWSSMVRSYPDLKLPADIKQSTEAQQDAAYRRYTQANIGALQNAGIPINDKNTFFTAFMGSGDSPKFIKAMGADPTQNAASMFPAAARENPTIFYQPNKGPRSTWQPRTLQQVYDLETSRFGSSNTTGFGTPSTQEAAAPIPPANIPNVAAKPSPNGTQPVPAGMPSSGGKDQYGGITIKQPDGSTILTNKQGRAIDPSTGQPTQASGPVQYGTTPGTAPNPQSMAANAGSGAPTPLTPALYPQPQQQTTPSAIPTSATVLPPATTTPPLTPASNTGATPALTPSNNPADGSATPYPATQIVIPPDQASTPPLGMVAPTEFAGGDGIGGGGDFGEGAIDIGADFAAARGGPVRKVRGYAKGGTVRAFDLGGSATDEDEDQQFENDTNDADMEDARAGAQGNPEFSGPPQQAGPVLEQPAQSAIPTAQDDQAQAQQGQQIASSNPYTIGALPRIGAGLNGGRMPGGGGPTGGRQGAQGGGPTSYYAGMNQDPRLEPDPSTPQIADANGNLSQGAAGAISGGLAWLAKEIGGGQSALPVGQNTDALKNMAATPEELRALRQSQDPNGALVGAMGNIAGLEAMHNWYIAHNMPEEANKAAASILIASRDAASHYGDQAWNFFHKGEVDKGIDALKKGYNDAILDGHTVDVQKEPNGNFTVTQKNMQDRAVWQQQVAPQQIMAAALGLKDGTMTWKLYSEAAQKYDPTIKAEQQQATPADEAAFGALSNWRNPQGAPQQGVASAQGTPQQGGQAIPVSAPEPGGPAVSAAPGMPQAAPQQVAPRPPVQQATQPLQGAIPTPQSNPAPVAQPVSAPASAIPLAAPLATPSAPNLADIDPSIVSAHQKQLEDQLQMYKRQFIDPADALRPKFDQNYYNSVKNDPARRNAYAQAYNAEVKDWQQTVAAPALEQYKSAQALAQKQFQDDLTTARQALWHNQGEQFSAASQMERERYGQQQANTREQNSEKAAALLEENRSKNENHNAALRNEEQQVKDIYAKPPDPDTEVNPSKTATYKAFVPDGTPASYAKLMQNPASATAVTNSVVDVARHNQMSPEEAAQSVFQMVAGGKNTFKAEPWMDGVGGRSLITFSDGHYGPIKIPTARLTQLMTVRQELADRAATAAKQPAAPAQPAYVEPTRAPKGEASSAGAGQTVPQLFKDWLTPNPAAGTGPRHQPTALPPPVTPTYNPGPKYKRTAIPVD